MLLLAGKIKTRLANFQCIKPKVRSVTFQGTFAFVLAFSKMHHGPIWYPGLKKKKYHHGEFSGDGDVVSTLGADEKREKPEVIFVCFDVVRRLGRQLTPDGWRRPHKG